MFIHRGWHQEFIVTRNHWYWCIFSHEYIDGMYWRPGYLMCLNLNDILVVLQYSTSTQTLHQDMLYTFLYNLGRKYVIFSDTSTYPTFELPHISEDLKHPVAASAMSTPSIHDSSFYGKSMDYRWNHDSSLIRATEVISSMSFNLSKSLRIFPPCREFDLTRWRRRVKLWIWKTRFICQWEVPDPKMEVT